MKTLGLVVLFHLVLFGIAQEAHSQDIVVKLDGDAYLLPAPTTLEESNRVATGLAEILTEVIASYEANSADASNQVLKIMEANKQVLTASKDQAAVLKTIPAGALAKTFALGAYVEGNPLPLLGGQAFGLGASATWNLLNLVPITGRAGFLIENPEGQALRFRLGASLAAEWWVF